MIKLDSFNLASKSTEEQTTSTITFPYKNLSIGLINVSYRERIGFGRTFYEINIKSIDEGRMLISTLFVTKRDNHYYLAESMTELNEVSHTTKESFDLIVKRKITDKDIKEELVKCIEAILELIE